MKQKVGVEVEVLFMPMNRKWQGDTGVSLLEAAAAAGIMLDADCAGDGTCGQCKVRVVSGTLLPLSGVEQNLLTDWEINSEIRLACCCRSTDDTVVEILAADLVLERKSALTGELALEEGQLDKAALEEAAFGIAFDIGTTTVVGTLWELGTLNSVDAHAETNPQGVFGADVISRINYASTSEEHHKRIHETIIQCLNQIAALLCGRNGISAGNIGKVTIVGNTTMCHLCLGKDSSTLARAPFAPAFTGPQAGRAKDIGIEIHENGQYYMLPCIAGHVGADITAGLLSLQDRNKKENALFIDIGTNGEIVLLTEQKTVACSTAAGPAFEGASIHQGMRAARGAVEKVEITKDGVRFKSIHDAEPVGICGSGIIDAVAELARTGLIDKTGKFRKPEKLREMGFAEEIISQIRHGETGNEFVIARSEEGREVVITQKDVREIQLAKAAIRSGMELMMQEAGIEAGQLTRVWLAGTFGSHLNIESAIGIGLIPDVPREKIHFIGNAASTGASLALLAQEPRRRAEELVRRIHHLELSACGDFQDKYLKAMAFS